jgi:tRNA threonylcarbamoyladenosine modification (KEOPS) complex  Pcc1 subunit
VSDGSLAWTAQLIVPCGSRAAAERTRAALAPEIKREVPRARVSGLREDGDRLVVDLTASDTGAMRAALNTYLGWIGLIRAAEDVARRDPMQRGSPPVPPP